MSWISTKIGTPRPHRSPLSTPRIHDTPNSSIEPQSSKICPGTQLKRRLDASNVTKLACSMPILKLEKRRSNDRTPLLGPNKPKSKIVQSRGLHFQDRLSSGGALTKKKKALNPNNVSTPRSAIQNSTLPVVQIQCS